MMGLIHSPCYPTISSDFDNIDSDATTNDITNAHNPTSLDNIRAVWHHDNTYDSLNVKNLMKKKNKNSVKTFRVRFSEFELQIDHEFRICNWAGNSRG